MTPEQRDDLATSAGAEIDDISGDHQTCYLFPNWSRPDWELSPFVDRDMWHPESSFDDCQPLFAEIKRRGLREEFEGNLALICPPSAETAINTAEYMAYCYCDVQPADIVPAFRKTIEEADET